MQTKNLIQMTANVVKITNLKKGDLIKMIEKEYSGCKTCYGIVLDLLNDGKSSFIEILKYDKSYNEIKACIKTYSGDDDISIFPAKLEELKSDMGDIIKSLSDGIEDNKKELLVKINALKKVKEFASGEMQRKIQEVEYREMTQEEYNNLKADQIRKIEELNS